MTKPSITTLLMFDAQAEEAMRFYLDVFGDSEIEQISYYEAGEHGLEGTVKHAIFRLRDQTLRCMDSAVTHPFAFNAAISLFVECESADQVDALNARLVEGGSSRMPLDAYPFSPRYAWVTDRFGVSWQLYLAPDRDG